MNHDYLPIDDVMDQLRQQLSDNDNVILQAPPGAGKTTRVPLACLDQPWLAGQRILMLEPRRLATRSAAYRMAEMLGETPGQTVGFRMRLESRISADTRIEVITEGLLTRLLQQDPTLEGVGLVIFDEFHERSLDADLALALTLKGRELFAAERDSQQPLKLLIMSATLDSDSIVNMLGNTPVVTSDGRVFPVDIIHGQANASRDKLSDQVVSTVQQAVQNHAHSSLLVFLPGQAEIQRVNDQLAVWVQQQNLREIELHPLYGNLTQPQQRQAIDPPSQPGKRKIVLATNIAETSLTIEGIDVIVDSGLAREPRFNPATGMSVLQTVRISRASSEQRAGRAGRLGPGHCYRLWSEQQHRQLAEQSTPEILQADLAPLAMQLLHWGIDDPAQLQWMDPPPPGQWSQAIELLERLGAIEIRADSTLLTPHGQAMAQLPTHPRLAHMLLLGSAAGHKQTACQLAALLSERDPFNRDNPDLSHRLELLSGQLSCPRSHQGWLQRIRKLAGRFQQSINSLKLATPMVSELSEQQIAGYLIACAYPDRVARQRHAGGYQLANGRSVSFEQAQSLDRHRWLAVAEISGFAGSRGDWIRSAALLDVVLFEGPLKSLVQEHTEADWNEKSGRFVAEHKRCIGALVLDRQKLQTIDDDERRNALIAQLKRQGFSKLLAWKDRHEQWCARVHLLHQLAPSDWPDTQPQTLLDNCEHWLAPYLDPVYTLQDFKKLDLTQILNNMLDWQQQQSLAKLAPTHLEVASGSRYEIDYRQSPPVLAVKLQEMFGCETTPSIADGRITLVVHLLSPAARPLQVTQDLGAFWRGAYQDVKKDMKGRYPKHPWPDDPINATPTRHTKARM